MGKVCSDSSAASPSLFSYGERVLVPGKPHTALGGITDTWHMTCFTQCLGPSEGRSMPLDPTTSLRLSFLLCEMGMLILPASQVGRLL